MRILVSGGVGFIGSNLIKHLLADKHEVHSIDNYSTGFLHNEVPGCRYIRSNCIFIGSILADEKYDVIFHLAALARISPSFEKPNETFDANVIGTQRILEYARKMDAKVIYAGSSSRWHDPTSSPYATSKYLGEQLCQMYRKSFGSKIQIARFYNVYGPNEIVDSDYATVIGIWRHQVKNVEPITIIGDGEQRRDFTHVDDIVDGLIRIMTTEHFHEDAWELGTGINYSINQVYEFFKERFGSHCINLPDKKGNYRTTLRERDDALDILGWKPRDQLRDYISSLKI
jgi:UDP-glucose 4-epimerase